MLESFQTPTMKCRILTIMGLLIRHASWISPRLNDIEFLGVLCNLLKDGNSRLRRRAISCLGELLFYIATQQLDATVEVEYLFLVYVLSFQDLSIWMSTLSPSPLSPRHRFYFSSLSFHPFSSPRRFVLVFAPSSPPPSLLGTLLGGG